MDAFQLHYKNVILEELDLLIRTAPKGVKRKAFKILPCIGSMRCSDFRDRGKIVCKRCPGARDEYPQHMRVFDFAEFRIGSTAFKVRHEENFLRQIRKTVAQLPLECFEIKDF